MDELPRLNEAVIPIEKFVNYALDSDKQPKKASAFELALGYTKDNVEKLIENIRTNLSAFPAKTKGDKGYGMVYEVPLILIGENGKKAKVLPGWIDDSSNGEVRLTSAYVDK